MSFETATAKLLPVYSPYRRYAPAVGQSCAPEFEPDYFHYNSYRLAYKEYGAASGTPVIYFHDSGSSRLEAALFHDSAQRNGFRLLVVDRPGIGKSDFFSCTRPDDFCAAILALTAQLGLQQFGVMSLGSGGIYALSLAKQCSERVMFMLSLGGVPGSVFNEQENPSYSASCWNELTPLLVKMLVRVRHRFFPADPADTLKRLEAHLCTADRHSLADRSLFRALAADHEEALSSGYKGIAQDIALCYRKLDYRLQEVTVPVEVWQGETDRLSQRSDCEYMAARMPHARYHRVADRGHFFFMHKMDRVFDELRGVLSSRVSRRAA